MFRTPQQLGRYIVILAAIVLPTTTFAATFTWDNGGGDNLWSNPTNWNPNGIPRSTGAVLFNGTSTANVTVDINVRVQSLTINSGYTGTITQSGAIMVGTGGYIQGGGTFNGGSAPILIQRNVTLTGGVLRSTSGILSISGSLVRTGGTFAHNDGTVSLAAPADRTLTMSSTFNRLDIESTKEDGLVAHWKLDETSIPTFACAAASSGACADMNSQSLSAVDSSGNGWNLSAPDSGWTSSANWPTHSSNAAPTSFANLGSMRFVRSRSWLRNNYGPAVGTSGTVSFWMRNADPATQQVLLSNYTSSGNFLLVIRSNGTWGIQGSPCDTLASNSSSAAITDGQWHNITFVKDASAENCTVYLDGVVIDVVGASSSATVGKGMMIGNLASFDAIGMTEGWLDDVRLYNRALSASEVASLAAGLYPVRTGGSTLTASTNITAASAFNIWNGTFDLDGNTLTAEGSLLNYDTLSVSGGVVLSDSTFTLTPSRIDIGSSITATLTDADENTDGNALDTVTVSTDDDTFTLTETTVNSGIFTAAIPTAHGTPVDSDGIISSNDSCNQSHTLTYTDDGDATDTRTVTVTILDPLVLCEGETETQSAGGGTRGGPGRGGEAPALSTPAPTPSTSNDTTVGNDADRPSSTSIFSDVRTSDWFGPSIKSLVSKGILSGYTDEAGNPTGDFGPADPVTVGQILKIALLSAGKELPSSLPLPENPTATDWSSPYIALAEKLDIDLASETSQRNASRGEVIHTLIQTFGINSEQSSNPFFSDLPAGHPYEKDILTAVILGLVKGDDLTSTVRPDDEINRAEVATLVIRFIGNVAR